MTPGYRPGSGCPAPAAAARLGPAGSPARPGPAGRQARPGPGYPLPGLNSLRGSSARRTAACMAREPGSSSRRIPSCLSRPTPCSPVTVPPSAMAASRNSSNAACAADRAAVVARRGDDQRVQVAVAGVRDRGDLHVVAGRDRLDLGQHRGHLRPRHADVLGEHRAEPLERRVGQPPGLEQRLGLGVVGRLLGPHRARRRSWPRRSRPPRRRRSRPACPPGPAAGPPRPASRPRCFQSSTACRQARSSSSRTAGVSPRRVIWATASPGGDQVAERARRRSAACRPARAAAAG